jgi:predicted nucleic acid-binding protein
LAAIRTRNKDIVIDISNVMLSPRIRMIIVDLPLLNDSKKIFFKHFEKGISFTDATTIAGMRRFNIETIITFDSHFKGMFTIL